MTRPSKDVRFLRDALTAASRSTCLRRAVGCVLVDAHGSTLATGYNGVARGQPHCNQPGKCFHPYHPLGHYEIVYPDACPGATAASGADLHRCEAIHAEQNALLRCPDPWAIEVVYSTASPCDACSKLLLGTAAKRLVYLELYDLVALQRLERAGWRTFHHPPVGRWTDPTEEELERWRSFQRTWT